LSPGFIGSHLVDRLLEERLDVDVLDDFSTGSRENVHPTARLYTGSVLDREVVDELVSSVDTLVAAPVHELRTLKPAFGTHMCFTTTPGDRDCPGRLRAARQARAPHLHVGGLRSAWRFDVARRGQRPVLGPTTERRWAYSESKGLTGVLALAVDVPRHVRMPNRACASMPESSPFSFRTQSLHRRSP
jgi:NAD dependent epimerase/dehydratase family